MRYSLPLSIYLAVSKRLEGYAERKLQARLTLGKEDEARLPERKGVASQARPEGQLVWFHAASVGESLSLLDLIETLLEEQPDANMLITTGTRSSAELLAKRLPDQTIHQFVPVDVVSYVRRFLDHWKPDLAVWTESELWPALIVETHTRDIPMLLLNARMSSASHKKWRWLPGFAGALLNRFDRILVQDDTSAAYLRQLGAPKSKLRINGSIKQSSGALPHDEDERFEIAGLLETRPVWLAASTHEGEEIAAIEAHRHARRAAPRLMLIIAPRHVERGPEILEALQADGWKVGVRSKGQQPNATMDIYLADTMGEMGLWYRLAPVTFLGGSLVPVGGHNPFEPAALGSAIIHGPHVASAQEVYDRLDDADGARRIETADQLGPAVIELLEPHRAAALAHAAWEISSSGAEPAHNALMTILDLLDKTRAR
jgi:3-deoxy-D-manno-octulosonic-acid transferase